MTDPITPAPVPDAPALPEVAAKRGWQTLVQGLAVAVIMAALTAFGSSLTAASWTEWASSWPIWTWAAFQAAATAGVAWAVRRFADQSGTEVVVPRRALPGDGESL